MRQRNFLYFPFDINPFLLNISDCFVVEFSVDEIELDFGFVVEIPEPAHHGSDFLNLIIKITVMRSCLINGLIKLELPEGVFLDILA